MKRWKTNQASEEGDEDPVAEIDYLEAGEYGVHYSMIIFYNKIFHVSFISSITFTVAQNILMK